MKTGIMIGTAAAALWLAGSAVAQPAPSGPDQVRLKLAHEIIDASGGVEALRTRMTAMFQSLHQLTASVTSPDAAALTDDMFKYIADEEMQAVPQLLDQTAEVYAEHLTVAELHAMLVWTSSPEGKSIQQKMPSISQDILARQQPLMKQMMAGIFQRAADHACAEDKCTPEQERQLVATMTRAAGLGNRPDTAAPATATN